MKHFLITITVFMLTLMLSLSTFAADTTVYVGGDSQSAVATFEEAVDALGGLGGTIVLCDDITVDADFVIPEQDDDLTVTEKGVRVKRVGAVKSDMYFEEGKSHDSIYEVTPYTFDVTVTTKKIRNGMTRESGRLDICYAMKIGGAEKAVRMKIEY